MTNLRYIYRMLRLFWALAHAGLVLACGASVTSNPAPFISDAAAGGAPDSGIAGAGGASTSPGIGGAGGSAGAIDYSKCKLGVLADGGTEVRCPP